VYAGLGLQPADVTYNSGDVIVIHRWNGWHITERPVVCPDTVLRRQHERDIGVMTRCVDGVKKRRPAIAAERVPPMT
jgi:hypothetical protein